MKKLWKLTASILVLLMMATSLPLTALAEDEVVTIETVEIEKVWVDEDAADRPDSVKLTLVDNDGVPVEVEGNPVTVSAATNWKGTIKNVPMSDDANSYRVEEEIEGYVSRSYYTGLVEQYDYPTNTYSGAEPDTAKAVTKREKMPGDGDWYIQSNSLDKDYIKGTDIVFGTFDIGSATIKEYYQNGDQVTDTKDRVFWKNTDGNYNDNGSTVMFYPEKPWGDYAEGELISTDHYFTLTFPDAVTYLDGVTLDGRKCNAVVTFKNLDIYKKRNLSAKGYRVAYPERANQLWVGAGYSTYAWGGAQMDITLTIPGVNDASVLVVYTDIDIETNDVPVGYPARPESVSLVSGFEKTVFTVELAEDQSESMKTQYTAFEQSDGVMRAYAYNTNDMAGSFQSGFVASANMSENGITIRWAGSNDGATEMFQTIPPFRLKTTIDGEIDSSKSVGGTITNQSDWTARDYGEGKIITITPNKGYHIDDIKIDGTSINLKTLADNATLTVTNTGWTEGTNKGRENVSVYQRANGVVDVYLPKQYLGSGNNLTSTRTDHWIDASFVANGYKYTVTNVQATDIEITKVWDDGDEEDRRPGYVSVNVMNGTEVVDLIPLSEENEWHAITTLPKYNENKEIINYTVKEGYAEGYISKIEGDTDKGFTITNTLATNIVVTKVWDDNDDEMGIRPGSVSVNLLADGVRVQTKTITEADEWTVTFEDFPVYNEGKKIEYTVTENKTEGYYPETEGSVKDGFTITNIYAPYTITYKLNGGTYEGSAADIVNQYPGGTRISIHKAPVRDGYTFLYWEGSVYYPDDSYTVTEDHTFTAQWKKNESKKSNNYVAPNTSDQSNINLWIDLIVISCAGICAVLIYNRKFKTNK